MELNVDVLRQIPDFTIDELDVALKKMSNLKCENANGMVAEMLKHGSLLMREEILKCFNDIPKSGVIEESWAHIIFQMLPKSGDLQDIGNWRPIAILPILYKLIARMVYHRIGPMLISQQSLDQHAFTPGFRIEDALIIAETMNFRCLRGC